MVASGSPDTEEEQDKAVSGSYDIQTWQDHYRKDHADSLISS